MSFTAAVPNTYTGTVENNGFWPDMELEVLMKGYRIDTRLAEPVIRNILVAAMLEVNDDLSAWAENKMDCEGVATVGEVKATTIDGEHLYTALYKRAVYNRAKGDFLHEFPDYSTTGTAGQSGHGKDRVEEKQEHADHYYAASLKAIRRIKGKRGTRVKLIQGNIQGIPGQYF